MRRLQDLEGLGAADDAQDRRSSLKEELSGFLKEELPKTQASFEKLKGYNDELDEARGTSDLQVQVDACVWLRPC